MAKLNFSTDFLLEAIAVASDIQLDEYEHVNSWCNRHMKRDAFESSGLDHNKMLHRRYYPD